MGTLAPRLATAALGLPAVLLFVWLGGLPFTIFIAVLAGVAAFELARMSAAWGDRANCTAAAVGAMAVVLAVYLYPATSVGDRVIAITAGLVAATSAGYLLFGVPAGLLRGRITSTLATIGMVGGAMAHGPMIRQSDDGLEWVVLLLFVTFSYDTGAYVVGRLVGRRQLAAAVSPGKTLEGALGGLVSAVLASVIAATLLSLGVSVVASVGLGVVLGVTGQLGDLVESRLKRQAGVKDSSALVPGHGGVLDRLDSIVWNLVVVYHFLS